MERINRPAVPEHIERVLGISRDIEGEDRRCVVSHPSAGGQCERRAVMKVYGLPFCEDHGLECEEGALEEAYGSAFSLYEAIFDPGQSFTHEQDLGFLANCMVFEPPTPYRSDDRDEVRRRAFPLREELVADTEHYLETWDQGRWLAHQAMRMAYSSPFPDPGMTELFEPIREHMAAQLAYAWALVGQGR